MCVYICVGVTDCVVFMYSIRRMYNAVDEMTSHGMGCIIGVDGVKANSSQNDIELG